MNKQMGIEWNLRALMEKECLHATADLLPLLAQRGIHLSRNHVYRLVTHPPLRISLDVLAALCDIFHCTPSDLITVKVMNKQVQKKSAVGESGSSGNVKLIKTRVHRPGKL